MIQGRFTDACPAYAIVGAVERPVPGHLSSVKLSRAWFVGCTSAQLGMSPISRTIQGTAIVLFRSKGRAAAFVDRCPHRNVPLSLGRVLPETGRLQCRYHGWQFDADGSCREVPGLCGEIDRKATGATTYAVREQDGLVWVWATPGEEPSAEPYKFPHVDDPRYTVVRREYSVPATLHATAENALDVPHTAFLHGGLFRTAKKETEIDVVVRRSATGVEAEYIGEPRPPGIAAKILAPGGGVVTHYDRFLLPCVVQVEYKLGEDSHLLNSAALTPVTDLETKLFAVIAFRTPLPGWLVRLFVTPVGERIFRQDAEILSAQTDAIRRFGGEQYANTPIDVLGQQIWRLLKAAAAATDEQAPALTDAEREYRLKMRV